MDDYKSGYRDALDDIEDAVINKRLARRISQRPKPSPEVAVKEDIRLAATDPEGEAPNERAARLYREWKDARDASKSTGDAS